MRTLALAALLCTAATTTIFAADAAPDNYWPKDARISILSPKSGATVTSPVTIKFGSKNLTVAPAGDKTPMSGHFHLLIDQGLPADLSVPLPANEALDFIAMHYDAEAAKPLPPTLASGAPHLGGKT